MNRNNSGAEKEMQSINGRSIALGGSLVACVVLFQSAPVFLTEAFVFVTILSTIPIYVLARIHPKAGGVGLVAATLVVGFMSIHEALLFICTNGTVGIALGITDHYRKKWWVSSMASGVGLTLTLGGLCVSGVWEIQAEVLSRPSAFPIIMLFSTTYSFVYRLILNVIFRRLFVRHAVVIRN